MDKVQSIHLYRLHQACGNSSIMHIILQISNLSVLLLNSIHYSSAVRVYWLQFLYHRFIPSHSFLSSQFGSLVWSWSLGDEMMQRQHWHISTDWLHTSYWCSILMYFNSPIKNRIWLSPNSAQFQHNFTLYLWHRQYIYCLLKGTRRSLVISMLDKIKKASRLWCRKERSIWLEDSQLYALSYP